MIIENVNIYDLVPSQIKDLIIKLNNALGVIKNRKQTISKIALYEKGKIHCPHCNSLNIVKNGHTKSQVQTYKCKNCCKRFNDLTNTVFRGTHLTYEQIEIFIQCFQDKVSLRKTSKRMKVHTNTVHLLRLKVINALQEMRKNTKLSGTIESDEIYKSINLKGTKPNNMPRFSKPRVSKGTTIRGINKHKVCIESAIDENDNTFLEIVGTGSITSDMIRKSLVPKIENIKSITTDCKSSYESVAIENNWHLYQIKSCGHCDEFGNSLANINSVHSGLSSFLSHFRGVSTKHLQGYLDWYIFDKYLNYSFEEDKKINEVIRKSINYSTIILTSNMYNNYSGIDFYDVYSDYSYSPSRIN